MAKKRQFTDSEMTNDASEKTNCEVPKNTNGEPNTSSENDRETSIARKPNSSGLTRIPMKPSLKKRLKDGFEMLINDRRFVIDPEGDVIFRWMTIVALAVGFNVWLIILRISFMELEEEFSRKSHVAAHPVFVDKWMKMWSTVRQAVSCSIFCLIDTLCDVIFVLDVLVNFRMGYLEQGLLVGDPRKLGENYYKKSSFRLDLICLLPLGRIVPSSDYIPRTTYRLHRLLKMYALEKFFAVWDSRTSNPTRHRATKLTFYLAGVIHWTGCIYYMVSKYEGFGSNEWVYPETYKNDSFPTKYIRVIYWSTVTLTTIGGTENPVTNLEHVFMIVTFMVGVFIFATVVGNVGDVISNMNAARQEYQAKMDAIKFYMNHRQVPASIQSRVKKWSNYAWSRNQALDDQDFLEFLPPRLRAEIAVHVHLETLQKVKIFSDCEEGFLGELVLRLRSQIFSPGDHICRRGEIGREMYIINHGKVQVVVTDPVTEERMVVATLSEGNYFGEISLLKLNEGQNRRTADVTSLGYSELLCLSKKDLMQALVEYPDAKDVLEKHGRDRVNQNKEAARLQRRISMPEGVTMLMKQRRDQANVQGETKSAKNRRMWKKACDKSVSSTELNQVIKTLRTFDSISTTKQIEELESKCEELTRKLEEKDQQLVMAVRRFGELEQLIGVNGTKNGHTRIDLSTASAQRGTDIDRVSTTSDTFDRRVRRIQDIFEGHIQRIYGTDSLSRDGNRFANDSRDDVTCYTDFDDNHTGRGKSKKRKKKSKNLCNLSFSSDHSMTKEELTLLIPGIKINDIMMQRPTSFKHFKPFSSRPVHCSMGRGEIKTKERDQLLLNGSSAHRSRRMRTSTLESYSSEVSDIMNNNEEEHSQSSQCVEVREMSIVSISPVTSYVSSADVYTDVSNSSDSESDP